MLRLTDLPFPLTSSAGGVWTIDDQTGGVVATAPGHTDLYVDPSGSSSVVNAPTLLGVPEAGDFRFSARVTVDFRSQFDAGVLLVWRDERTWAKFCFEFSPAAEPMVVSVVTRGVSDDANAYTLDGRSVWLRISRIGDVYAFHASADGASWTLIRVFTLGPVADDRIGLEAQSPTGDGCRVAFDDVRFAAETLADLRDGS